MKALAENELAEAMKGLPEWRLEEDRLVRDWSFPDFVSAMSFVNRVAERAEAAGHHPDIDIRYNRVRLGLVTHDSGGITAKDVAMAHELSR